METKKLGTISTDWHIHKDNINEIKDCIKQIIDFNIKNKIDKHFVLGDIFESRNAQPLDVLDAFSEVINMFSINNITLYIIAGNHDKINYSSKKSYLDTYKHHPNVFICDSLSDFLINGVNIYMIPFFEDPLFEKEFEKISKYGEINILMCHQAVNGVKNNDGSSVEGTFRPAKFSKFENVFIGHYHNRQSTNNNIHYIGSLMPKNFGEDNEKGFTVLYEDGSFKYKNLSFKKYENVIIDVDKISLSEIKELTKHFAESDDNIKFKIKGDKSKLDVLDIDEIKQAGIKVSKESNEIEQEIIKAEHDEFTELNKDIIITEFPIFIEKYGIEGNIDLGIELLIEQLT